MTSIDRICKQLVSRYGDIEFDYVGNSWGREDAKMNVRDIKALHKTCGWNGKGYKVVQPYALNHYAVLVIEGPYGETLLALPQEDEVDSPGYATREAAVDAPVYLNGETAW